MTISSVDLSALAKSNARLTKEYVAAELTELLGRVRALEELFQELPPVQRGERGERGEKGEKGETGERGDIGMPGPVGEKGEAGRVGDPGIQGLHGVVGAEGPRGGTGKDGSDGKDGRDGREGKDGRDGIDGKDALDIRILQVIDIGKTFPRGTFAQDKGGISRFDGELWRCIVRGVDRETEEQSEDGRTLTRKTFYSDGSVFERSFRMTVTIYRGIFTDGTEYQRGDVVTYGGSAWYCQVDATKTRPETDSRDWRLMVKKGAQGANGKDGSMGVPGPAGKDGRDLTRIGH